MFKKKEVSFTRKEALMIERLILLAIESHGDHQGAYDILYKIDGAYRQYRELLTNYYMRNRLLLGPHSFDIKLIRDMTTDQ